MGIGNIVPWLPSAVRGQGARSWLVRGNFYFHTTDFDAGRRGGADHVRAITLWRVRMAPGLGIEVRRGKGREWPGVVWRSRSPSKYYSSWSGDIEVICRSLRLSLALQISRFSLFHGSSSSSSVSSPRLTRAPPEKLAPLLLRQEGVPRRRGGGLLRGL